MKNRLLSLLLATLLSVMMNGLELTATEMVVEVEMNETGILKINGIEIVDGDPVILFDDQLLFPLRTILEVLGSTVIWESSTGNIYFDFDGVVYAAWDSGIDAGIPRGRHIYIGNVQYINSFSIHDLIFMHPMGLPGFVRSINERTYLAQWAGERLFEALGCEVKIDIEQGILSISFDSSATGTTAAVNEVVKDNMYDIGTLIINDVKITDRDPVIRLDDQLLFPLKTIFETLGSTIIYESSTGNIYFDFDGVVYASWDSGIVTNIPNGRHIYIGNVQNINSIYVDEHIQLHPMGLPGFTRSINGRMYLVQEAGQFLLEAFGLEVEINIEQGMLRISDN